MNESYNKYDRKVANSYDSDRQDEEHWKLENEFIKSYFNKNSSASILDIPVGTARLVQFYPENAQVVGVDMSLDMLEVARKKIEDTMIFNKIILQQGDAAQLNFLDNQFDQVICFRLLHLVPHDIRLKIIQELLRVTKKSLLIQIYLLRNKSLFKRVCNRIKSTFIITKETSNTVYPWSHINSFELTKKQLNYYVTALNIKSYKTHYLCQYNNQDIIVLEINKNEM